MRALWFSLELGLIALLFWLEAGDLLVAVRLPDAPAAALAEVPSVPFALLGTIVALAGLGGLVARSRLPGRVARLLTFAVVLYLAADLSRASGRPALSVEARTDAAIAMVATLAQQDSAERGLATDPRFLSSNFAQLGPSPFFSKGERLNWLVDVRGGCRGPAADAKGRPPATVIVCMADDRKRAWLSVVTLDQTFGDPVVHPDPTPLVAEPPEPRPGQAPPPPPSDDEPQPLLGDPPP